MLEIPINKSLLAMAKPGTRIAYEIQYDETNGSPTGIKEMDPLTIYTVNKADGSVAATVQMPQDSQRLDMAQAKQLDPGSIIILKINE